MKAVLIVWLVVTLVMTMSDFVVVRWIQQRNAERLIAGGAHFAADLQANLIAAGPVCR